MVWADEQKASNVDQPKTDTKSKVQNSGDVGKASAAKKTEEHPAILMPEVVITATRSREDVTNIPQSVTVVTQEDIERRQARTPNQMLREEPGVFSAETATQGSPIIRGQIGNRVLYLWDGIPINNGSLNSGPMGYFNQFPLGAIDRMEVIRGPGSVQYGSCAIGGVINIISKKVDEFPNKPEMGGDVTFRYGTVDRETTEWTDLWYADSKVSIIGGVTFQDVGNTRGPGVGVMENTGFDAEGGYFDIAYKPATDQVLRLSWIYDKRNNVETYVQSKLNASGIPRVFNPYERRGIGKLEYEIDNLCTFLSELKFYTYYQSYDQMRERRVESTTTLSNTKTSTDQRIYGGGIQMTTPWNFLGNNKLIYGSDYRHEILNSVAVLDTTTKATGVTVATIPNGKVPDGTYDVFDIFAISEMHPLERLTLSIGGRFEKTKLHSDPVATDVIPNAGYTIDDLKLDKSWSSTTWSIGAIYALTTELDIAGNIATGFRAPTFSDTLSTGTPIFSSKVASVPSPNVDPEKSITYEIGPRFHNERWNVTLTGYYTELTDVIRSAASGTVTIAGQGTFTAQRSSNAGEGYVWGIEFGSAYRPHPDWTLFANATYTKGRDTNFDEYYRFIPPLFGSLGLRYENPSKRWWAEATEVLVDELRHHAPNDETDATFSTDPGYGSPSASNPPLHSDFTMPGYAITNLRGGVNVWQNQSTKRRFDLTLDINNLFDKAYREAYSQQELVAPGLNFIITGKLTF